MVNRKGQALVEFVIILPVFFVILFSAIDLGNIIYKKYHLENDLDYIVELYNLKKTDEINKYVLKQDIKTNFDKIDNMMTITVEKNVDINTPGINLILKNPYKISVSRVIYDE